MMELLGRMPKNMALSGKHSKKYFNSLGHLRRISGLNYWPLKKVLMEKYRIKEEEAQALSDFLVPMLEWYPHKRATALQMLQHPWLNMGANYEYKYTDTEYEKMMLKKDMKMTGGKGGRGGLDADSQQEMNELIESDEELNAADLDEDRFGAVHPHIYSSDEEGTDEDYEYDADERSLVDSDEERGHLRRRKAREAKVNNSFTGPYPLDPTDFNHTDKGPNNQFEHMVQVQEAAAEKKRAKDAAKLH
jgi:serine/threonine protein kinase